MDLYIALFQVYNQYTLGEIEISKSNIRGLLKKVVEQRLVKYFPYLENFYKILIFKIIDQGYHNKELYKDKQKLNDYICDYLKYLTFHGTYNKEQIYTFIENYEVEIIKETARVLCSLKTTDSQHQEPIILKNNESIKTEFSS